MFYNELKVKLKVVLTVGCGCPKASFVRRGEFLYVLE